MGGRAGVGKAEESRRRPLLVSPDPATGPGAIMDAQGRHALAADEDTRKKWGWGRGTLTFFTAGWKWKSPASLRSSQIMGMRGTASMADSAHRPLGCSPAAPAAGSVACPAPPLRAGRQSFCRDERWPHGLLGGAVPTPPARPSHMCSLVPSTGRAWAANRQPEAKGFLGVVVFLHLTTRHGASGFPPPWPNIHAGPGIRAQRCSLKEGHRKCTHKLIVPIGVESHGGRG